MRSMVTGANGIAGRHICAGLASAEWEVVAVVRDAAKGKALMGRCNC